MLVSALQIGPVNSIPIPGYSKSIDIFKWTLVPLGYFGQNPGCNSEQNIECQRCVMCILTLSQILPKFRIESSNWVAKNRKKCQCMKISCYNRIQLQIIDNFCLTLYNVFLTLYNNLLYVFLEHFCYILFIFVKCNVCEQYFIVA